MNSIRRYGICFLLILVALGACNMGLGSSPESSAGAEHSTDPQAPGVTVSIPMVSVALLDALDAVYAPAGGDIGPQALLFATRAEFQLWQGGVLQDEWNVSAADGLTEVTSGPQITDFHEVPAGIGYTIEVEVFNSRVSDVDPVVTGTSEPFSVGIGSTEVPIICDPYEPTLLDTDGQTESFTLAQTPFEFDLASDGDVSITGLGGETWFELAVEGASDRFVRLYAEPGGDAEPVLLQYEDDVVIEDGPSPGLGWGFFPDADGGQGGTRTGIMGSREDDTVYYLAAVLLNRDGSTAEADLDVFLDIYSRPFVAHDNAAPFGTYADEHPGFVIEPLAAGVDVSKTLFWEGALPDKTEMIHYYELSGIPWNDDALPDPLEISVTATFDVLEPDHLMGFVEEDGEDWPRLGLTVEDTDEVLDLYYGAAIADPDRTVTEHADGSTSISFAIDVPTTDMERAIIGVSSYWEGNRYTLNWTAPGSTDIIVH